MSHRHAMIDAIDSSGTHGARKPRGRSGRVLRRTSTPAALRSSRKRLIARPVSSVGH